MSRSMLHFDLAHLTNGVLVTKTKKTKPRP